MLSFVIPVRDFPINGFGVNVSNDNLGPENNIQLQFALSSKVNMRFGSLLIGVQPGIFTKSINGNQLDPVDRVNDQVLLPLLGRTETQTRFNLGAGVVYQSNNGYYIGASSINLVEPAFDFGIGGFQYVQKRTYAVHGGTQFRVNNKIVVKPNMLVRSNLSGLSFDLGAIVNYGDRMWSGLSYRLEESLVVFLGYSLLDDVLKAGYSFDLVVHNTKAKQPTSHEIFLKYNLPELMFGGRKAVKTPRFTF
jgi:type IX secretion system PorP/SprF family membrane protein